MGEIKKKSEENNKKSEALFLPPINSASPNIAPSALRTKKVVESPALKSRKTKVQINVIKPDTNLNFLTIETPKVKGILDSKDTMIPRADEMLDSKNTMIVNDQASMEKLQ